MSSPTTSPRPRPLALTPPQPQPQPHVHIRVHAPPSPSPFMKEFIATAQPPPNAKPVSSSASSSTTSRLWLWKTANDIRRVHILLALLTAVAILLSAIATTRPTAFLSREHSFTQMPVPIPVPTPTLPGLHDHLHLYPHPHHRRDKIAPRQQQANQSTASLSKPTPTSSSPTATPVSTSPMIPTSSPPLPTPFPQPFDDTLSGTVFVSASCQKFFTAFTNDINFRSCRAFSFLYAASEEFLDMLAPEAAGFANVTDPLQALTDVMWGVCNTSSSQSTCASRMADYEQQLQRACKAELSDEQPLAVTALHGFRNFNLMRTAACLANQRTSSYCFVDAVAAAFNGVPSDIYFYQLPLGTSLPGTKTQQGIKMTATCSTCVRSLMDLYSQYLPRASGGGGLDNGTELLIQRTYGDASAFVGKQCGTGYVANTLSLTSAALPRIPAQWGIAPLLLCMISILFFQREAR